ncbi:MAG: hypothetical protein HZB67_03190 [Candidatus Aenigmarchaeota archaeon]|nr:hypothetical protein [Candidatus Aenigmarchaeota archaeon]
MAIHPIDNRYKVPELEGYFSDDAQLKYIFKIELPLIRALEKRWHCPKGTYEKISERASQITGEMWAEKQRDPKYKHNIRALIALVNEGLPEDLQRFFHLGYTSYDAVDNGYILGLKDVTSDLVIPDALALGNTLLGLSDRYKSTVQVGRSHGQHGEPTTFGREIAYHADRWGKGIGRIMDATERMEGKIAGAMGTKASLALLGDPDELENAILGSVGLTARISTQIVQPEDAANYYSQLLISFGILNDLANDMRHLARTEIGEISLEMPEGHGRSSTMVHKGLSEQGAIIGNPEDFENVCGQYRAVMPHIISVYLNQESEHNRDIRNSAAERYYKPEILSAFIYSIRRMNDTMGKVRANEDVMRRRVENAWHLLMEPAYIALALDGEARAQDYVRNAVKEHGDFKTALESDARIRSAIDALPAEKRAVFESPLNYIGESEKQASNIVLYWSAEFSVTEDAIKQRGV